MVFTFVRPRIHFCKTSHKYCHCRLPPTVSHVVVQQVLWEDRIMPFNITPATNYSNWLNINGINRFLADFDTKVATPLAVILEGWINEPCPAQWLFDHPKPICEYVIHGREGQNTCCPMGLTTPGTPASPCGCRDDLDQTPFRMGYELESQSGGTSTFNFNVAMVSNALQGTDSDGYDMDLGVPVGG